MSPSNSESHRIPLVPDADQSESEVHDWKAIIEFHRHVIKQSEEDFYSLSVRKGETRWTPLENQAVEGPVGSWLIEEGALVNKHFLDRFPDLGVEFYLGMGNVIGRKRGCIQPVFVMEVTVKKTETGLSVSPGGSKWALAPTFVSLLDHNEIALVEDTEEACVHIIERAVNTHNQTGGSFVEHLRNSLNQSFPALTQQMDIARWDWCLFAPPDNISPFNVNIVRDYDTLVSHLAGGGSQGGLRLLEAQGDAPSGNSQTPLAFIPLNTSQLDAVQNILGDQPVTVISGPPGCGKSQVVVSTLLNAWASGQKTLFASTNNKAVDVVLERLQRFESEFPIAVRAGAKRSNRVLETLRRAGSIIERHTQGTLELESDNHACQLQEERAKLRNILDAGQLAIIDEQLKSALKAYSIWKETLDELAQADLDLKQQASVLYGKAISPTDLLNAIYSARQWIADTESISKKVDENISTRQHLVEQIDIHKEDRNRSLTELGLDPATVKDWRWLASAHPTQAIHVWWNRFVQLLQSPLEKLLDPIHWSNTYNEFRSASKARDWLNDAAQLANDLRSNSLLVSAAHKKVDRSREELADASRGAESLSLSINLEIDEPSIKSFLAQYREHAFHAQAWNASIPFTRANDARSKINRALYQARRHLPETMRAHVTKRGQEPYVSFLPIAEALAYLFDARRSAAEAEANQAEAERTVQDLTREASRLGLPSLHSGNADIWLQHAASLDRRSRDVVEIAEAWECKEAQEAAFKNMANLASQWAPIGRGMPLRVAFDKGIGKDFGEAVAKLAHRPNRSDLDTARQFIHAGVVSRLEEGWREGHMYQSRATSQEAQLDALPLPTSFRSAWWKLRPSFFRDLEEPSEIPMASDATLIAPMAPFERWMSEWHQYHREGRPEIEARIAEEKEWAHSELARAVDSAPLEDRNALKQQVTAMVSGTEDWSISELAQAFHIYSPDFIQARIERIDAELEALSFQKAKRTWLDRASNSRTGLTALNRLESAYRRNLRLKPDNFSFFKDALEILPIWIATGQGTSSIPLKEDLFDILILDEASQCTLTNILPLLFRAKRLVVIGDREQLPAIPSISVPIEESLLHRMHLTDLDFFLRHCENNVYDAAIQQLPGLHSDVVPLLEHYRSHPLIIGFSNSHIYQSQLQLKKAKALQGDAAYPPGVYHQHVSGMASRGKGSWQNLPEAHEVMEVIRQLKAVRSISTIGVVTPFRGQKNLISDLLGASDLRNVEVGTAHTFQGDERDAIIFSPVVARGMPPATSHWASNSNLVNVAITRARDVLVVVGDMDACRDSGDILRELSKYCEQVDRLRTSSPAELALFTHLVMEGMEATPHFLIGDAEVDFLIPASPKDLCIEIDGKKEHEHRKAADAARDAYLSASGYTVLRFAAREVLSTPGYVISEIRKARNLT